MYDLLFHEVYTPLVLIDDRTEVLKITCFISLILLLVGLVAFLNLVVKKPHEVSL
ncbi:hypothetical protein NMS_1058 [Nonlabens marinus S1-08]|uniref:Uncharacterized protein n=1 Tax=Nonlabens marinus S1-08 TaxID=1454201 RepID=W8VWV1_9FLAO|nr:hypothetical protein NMS_1058 [Nonlabens marinus S1-08]